MAAEEQVGEWEWSGPRARLRPSQYTEEPGVSSPHASFDATSATSQSSDGTECGVRLRDEHAIISFHRAKW